MITGQSPAISVCLPVYNAERYLAEAVESVLAQTFTDFEFLILDDGSTDGSLAILKQYEARDPRVRVFSRPNKGLITTLNELIELSRGEFLARMDADDVSLPQRFERQIEHLQANPDCVVVGCQALVIDPDGDPITVWFEGGTHEELDSENLKGEKGGMLCHPSVMMRRSSVLDVGCYRDQFRYAEDLDLWLRLAERGRLANLPIPLLKYRTHQSNRSELRNDRADQDFHQILLDARVRRGLPVEGIPPRPFSQEPAIPQAVGERWAWQALIGGHPATARKHARRLLSKTPLSIRAWKLFLRSNLAREWPALKD